MKSNENFFRDVYEVVKLIPEGRVTTYGAIADYLGTKNSSRMVGWALNQSFGSDENIPAHRVVNRLGILSGKHYFPQNNPMEQQLTAEGIEVENDKVIHFKRLFWSPKEELL